MKTKQIPTAAGEPLVVATVHSLQGLGAAADLKVSDGIAFVEVRADVFAGSREDLVAGMSAVRVPVLLTVRHPAEGGEGRLSMSARRDLFGSLSEAADAIDVELRCVSGLADVVGAARRRGRMVVVSHHNFRRTPAIGDLRDVVRRGFAGGADIVKVATWLRGPRDLEVLLQLQATTEMPLATMGMGPLGKVSRLALAAAGSRLNYGYLDKPRVEGQWAASELVSLLREVVP